MRICFHSIACKKITVIVWVKYFWLGWLAGDLMMMLPLFAHTHDYGNNHVPVPIHPRT